jgi:predicted  nucleic acid-binding Zn-ribbon protein
MPGYITVPQEDFQTLLRELREYADACTKVAQLRIGLRIHIEEIRGRVSSKTIDSLTKAAETCEDVSQLRVELLALERRLRELDKDLTPVRPASQMDIRAAFDNANDYAAGKKKPPDGGPGRY